MKSLQAPKNVAVSPTTPLLVSDTDYSPPSSPSWSPLSHPHGLSRDVSPSASPTGPATLKRFPMEYMTEMQAEERSRIASQALYRDAQPDPSRDEVPIRHNFLSEGMIEIMPPSPPARFLSVSAPEYSMEKVIDAVEAMKVVRAPAPPPAEMRPLAIPVEPERSIPAQPETPVVGSEAQEDDASPSPASASYHSSPSPPPLPVKQKKQKRQKLVGQFVCPDCPGKTFTRNFDLKRHIKSVHEKDDVDQAMARTCPCCHEVLSRDDAFNRHCRRVPGSCLRRSQLFRKSPPPEQPESLYKSVRTQAEKIYKTRRKAAQKAGT